MMKSLADAKKYINKIKSGLIKHPFANQDGIDALKIFAKANDEDNFKAVVNFMRQGILTLKDFKFFKKEPLAYIELNCEIIDNDYLKEVYTMYQIYRGFKVKRPPIGKTQKFFRKIYGNHLFKKKSLK